MCEASCDFIETIERNKRAFVRGLKGKKLYCEKKCFNRRIKKV